nr:hypothetical protein [Tanacetum cinerariifolium]
MSATKSFDDGLMEVEEKLEEILKWFQKGCSQVHQEFSLQSDSRGCEKGKEEQIDTGG